MPMISLLHPTGGARYRGDETRYGVTFTELLRMVGASKSHGLTVTFSPAHSIGRSSKFPKFRRILE